MTNKKENEILEMYKEDIRIVDNGSTISFDLFYPGVDENPKFLLLGLCHVRAADNLRISYDFDRGGWKIEQFVCFDKYKENGQWEEKAFLRPWQIRKKIENK